MKKIIITILSIFVLCSCSCTTSSETSSFIMDYDMPTSGTTVILAERGDRMDDKSVSKTRSG